MLSNNNEMKEIHQLFLSTVLIYTSFGCLLLTLQWSSDVTAPGPVTFKTLELIQLGLPILAYYGETEKKQNDNPIKV